MFRVPCRLVNGFMLCPVESLSLTALSGGTERSRNGSRGQMRIGPRPCHVGKPSAFRVPGAPEADSKELDRTDSGEGRMRLPIRRSYRFQVGFDETDRTFRTGGP